MKYSEFQVWLSVYTEVSASMAADETMEPSAIARNADLVATHAVDKFKSVDMPDIDPVQGLQTLMTNMQDRFGIGK